MNKQRLPQESAFEYKLRLIKAHQSGELDADWNEICALLGNQQNPDHLRKVAKGIMEYDDYIHGHNGVANRILAISDLHVPFQLPVETFADYAGRVDTLVLNGDIVDMQAISKFPKTYRVSPIEELIQARAYIIDLIRMLRPEQVVVIDGNHEKRFESYLARNLDSSVAELMPSSAMELVVIDGFHHYQRATGTKMYYEPLIELFAGEVELIYPKSWKYKIGSTLFVHPLSYSSGMLKTAEKAVDYFLRVDRDFKTVVMAHTHKAGMYIQGGITIFEQGCCCRVDRMQYADGKLFLPQQMGYLYLEHDVNGDLIDEHYRLHTIKRKEVDGV